MKKIVICILAVLLCICLAACGCEHQWNEADCTNPKTCSVCSKTKGNALGHSWKDADCENPKTCSTCEITEGEKLGHNFDDVDGLIKCTVCGKVDESKNALYFNPYFAAEEREEFLKINEQNDVQNASSYYVHNGWIYGQHHDNYGNSVFAKVRTDGNDYTVLDKGFAINISIVDNYIYYMIINDDVHEIRKMKTSGEGKKTLVKAFGNMQIKDGYIYYSDHPSSYTNDNTVKQKDAHLFRCDLSGKNKTKIIAKPTYHFYVFDNGILYQDDKDGSSLHKCNLDGTNDAKINDRISYWPIYDGEFIYYITEKKLFDESSRTIRKVKPDGTSDQEVSKCKVSNGLIMKDDYLYFVNADDSHRIYKIKKDGSDLSLVTQDKNTSDIQFLGERLKYIKRDSEGYIENILICDLDGSGKHGIFD